jgi:hypothetical protein
MILPEYAFGVLDTNVWAHEVGHALWTPAEEWTQVSREDLPYVQALEDARLAPRICAVQPLYKEGTLTPHEIVTWSRYTSDPRFALALIAGMGTKDVEVLGALAKDQWTRVRDQVAGWRLDTFADVCRYAIELRNTLTNAGARSGCFRRFC